MKKICPNCGKEVDPEEKYCPFCHFNLVNNDETMVIVNVGLLGLKNNESTAKKDKEKAQAEEKKSVAKPEKKSSQNQKLLFLSRIKSQRLYLNLKRKNFISNGQYWLK